MVKRLAVILCVVGVLGLAVASPSAAAPSPSVVTQTQRVVVGYFASWDIHDRGFFPRDIAADKLTHINYAFASVGSNGKCVLYDPWADYERPFAASESVDGAADSPGQALMGNFNQLRKLKAAHPGVKILISIGGWTESKFFSNAARTRTARRTFVKSCIDLLLKGNLPLDGSVGGAGAARSIFDGIDIDWEFPVCCGYPGNVERASDKHHATQLFAEFRRQLDALGALTGKKYLLTAALPSGSSQPPVSYELGKVASILSWINVMAYDMHGSWDSYTAFNSPFTTDPADPIDASFRQALSVQGTVSFFESQGVPHSKLVVGVPFYGNQYVRAPDVNHGLYQGYDNTGLDGSSWATSESVSYHDLVDIGHVVSPGGNATQPVGQNGFTRYWRTEAGEPWLYNPAAPRGGQTVGSFICYEDPASIAERVGYIEQAGLRGAMVWELGLDDDAHDLSNALATLIGR